MKLTNKTINVLKNLQLINDAIVVNEGSTLSTVSNDKTVFALVNTDMVFPEEGLAVFNLPAFLQIITLLTQKSDSGNVEPEIHFNENLVTVSDGKSSKYIFRQAKKTLIQHTDKKEIPMQDAGSFEITWEQMNQVVSAAKFLQLTTVCFYTQGNKLYFGTFDPKQTDSDNFSVLLAEVSGETQFKLFLDIEKLKLLPDNYKVYWEPNGRIIRLHSKEWDATYWTALEATSTLESTKAA